MTGMPNAQPNPLVAFPNMLMHGAQAVVARMPATHFDATFPRCQIQFVMENGYVRRFQFEETHCLAD